MNKWKEVKLGDVCEIIMGQSPKSSSYNDKKQGIIFYQGNKDFGRLYPNISMYTTEPKKFAYPEDVLISVRAPVGELNIADNKCCIGRGLAAIRLKSNHNRFLFYLLKEKVKILNNIATGTIFSSINKSILENLSIKLPPLPIQKKIADILSVIDEKIETLQNINSTLEEMAKAIFKSWFVDFDIVKAKEEGKSDSEIAKELGINEDIVKLFPSEFEESEIGKIPKGWEVRKLGDFFPIKTGKKNANIATNNGKYPFFTCSQEILKTNSYSFNDNAILLAGNGDFNIKWYRGKFEAYQRTYVLIPYEKINLGYLFFSMKYFLDLITGASQGSVIKFITKGMIENFKIVYPDNNKFITFFNQILNNLESNTQQIQTLQELRDTLLPKLIKGEIEVDKLDIKGIEDVFDR